MTSVSAQAISLPGLQQQLSNQPIVRGDFEQSRKMEMFNQPLTSQGKFLLAEKQGLLWQQTTPFPVSLILTKDKLSQQFADQPAQVVSASENPMVFYFSHVFLSLFKGDTSQLTDQFDMVLTDNTKTTAKESQWQLVLTPKSAPLNAILKTITINGQDYINHLTLTEIRGDITDITFSNQRTVPAELTSEEQRAFQF
nr:outer membrane lipoprotein carrier protein LolA [Photobacterium lipolyticum]